MKIKKRIENQQNSKVHEMPLSPAWIMCYFSAIVQNEPIESTRSPAENATIDCFYLQ